jgi:excinuclease UvrABC nuclease subunit|tara:strand:- start:2987 stop:3544 length:558 start_codon:yes stop_codon:yes gene_type:complete
MTVSLYRHFDGDGELLYVGVSLNAVNRLSQHKVGSGWAGEIKRVDIDHYPTREEALEAETNAIVDENPLHNIRKKVNGRGPEYEPYDLEHRISQAVQSENAIVKNLVEFDPLYTAPQAAKLLKISTTTLKALAVEGKIGYIVTSRCMRRYKDGRRVENVTRVFTGWQIIEYIENLQATKGEDGNG